MKELTTRAISGLLYVVLLIGSLFHSPLAFYIVITGFSALALWEFIGLIKFKSYFVALLPLFFGLLYFQQIPPQGISILLIVSLAVNCWITILCFQQNSTVFTPLKKLILCCFYLIGSSAFIPLLMGNSAAINLHFILVFYVSIWTNNSFAYLFGSTIGKHKLFPAISPKKSWEGYFGGMFATLLFLYVSEQTHPALGTHWITLGVFIPLLATVGDFVQSYFKRRVNVKDSGSLIPGHGGFYDRMDSVIYCAPFYYLFLKLI